MIKTLDEAIAHAKAIAKENREEACNTNNATEVRWFCEDCAADHEQLVAWLEELKGLRLLVEWAIECGFGYNNLTDELFEKYEDEIKDIGYNEGLIYIATREANK